MSVLAMAKDLVLAQIQAGALPLDAMQPYLQDTYAHLMALKAQEDGRSSNGTAERAVDHAPVTWRKSVRKHMVVCLECGESFKQLSPRHLKRHALDPKSYRAKYGIPRPQPLAAKVVTAYRKQMVQQSRPWEKAPTYLHAQARKTAVQERPVPPRRARKRPHKAP